MHPENEKAFDEANAVLAQQEMKPCPLCGGTADLTQVGNAFTKKRAAVVKCLSCQLTIKAGAIHNTLAWCVKKVIEKWNKRPEALSHMPKWIPTSERLPEDSEAVVFYARKAGGYGYSYVAHYDNGKWLDDLDHDIEATQDMYQVILWMPLPSPEEK